MYLIKAMCIAIGTYSIVPVPAFEWDEKSMRIAICFLPIVGIICGGALVFWNWVCERLELPMILFAAVAAALPLIITGGIHMDGFMDTSDALASHQSREQKLAIMKDAHCGAFAVIRCAVYLLLSLGLYSAAYGTAAVYPVCIGFVLSRVLTVVTALTLPNARGSGMLAAFTEHAVRRKALFAMSLTGILCVAAMMGGCGISGLLSALLAVAVLIWYRAMARRQFGGATGDTSGYFLQIAELALLAGAYIGGLLS